MSHPGGKKRQVSRRRCSAPSREGHLPLLPTWTAPSNKNYYPARNRHRPSATSKTKDQIQVLGETLRALVHQPCLSPPPAPSFISLHSIPQHLYSGHADFCTIPNSSQPSHDSLYLHTGPSPIPHRASSYVTFKAQPARCHLQEAILNFLRKNSLDCEISNGGSASPGGCPPQGQRLHRETSKALSLVNKRVAICHCPAVETKSRGRCSESGHTSPSGARGRAPGCSKYANNVPLAE